MTIEKPSLYQQLASDIREYIPAHALAEGDRLPAIQELCVLFNVSHSTVRAALSLLTREGVVESRPRQGIFVSRPRSPVGDAAQREKVIGLLLTGEESAFEAGIIRGVMSQSLKAGYQVIVASHNSEVLVEARQMEELAARVSGLIIFPAHGSGNYASYAMLLEMGLPWVFIDRSVPGLAASLVATDNEYGGYLAARHLLQQGCRQVYAISAKPVTSIQERVQGFRRALKEWGLSSARSVRSSPDYEFSVGYSLTRGILEECAGQEGLGLFVMDETLALPCYAALKEAQMHIPRDVAVISYDDMRAEFFDPPLSAIRQDPHRMGIEATRVLTEQIQNSKASPREIRLKPELIVRNSTDVSLPSNWSQARVSLAGVPEVILQRRAALAREKAVA